MKPTSLCSKGILAKASGIACGPFPARDGRDSPLKYTPHEHTLQVEMAKHVGIVEAEVDAPLFERHGGKWVLNEEGRLFAPKASQSILYARMGLDLVQSHVKLQTNRLFVGYPAGNNPSNRLRE